MTTIARQIRDALTLTSLPSSDTPAVIATGLLALQTLSAVELFESGDGLFENIAARLEKSSIYSGATLARDWLEDPGLSQSTLRECLAAMLPVLKRASLHQVDWDAEAEVVFEPNLRGLNPVPIAIARELTKMLQIPDKESCCCVFPSCATIAWHLAAQRPVRLWASSPDTVIPLAILAAASNRPLAIDRRDPVGGPGRPSPIDMVDHIVSAPPFGLRVEEGIARHALVEVYQLDWLRRKARSSFSTLVSDGALFREVRGEVDVRAGLVDDGAVRVTSLPAGLWGRTMNVSTSLLQCFPNHVHGEVELIDARSMSKQSSGRVQDVLVVQHLQNVAAHGVDDDQRIKISGDELAANNYVLLPERYVRTSKALALAAALSSGQTVALGEVATVERPKAPRPIMDSHEQPAQTCLEISPADLIGGKVRPPSKQVSFAADEVARVKSVTVELGDILVSIKGNVGIIGQVPLEAALADMLDMPWVVSQSLAVIRWRPNKAIPTSEILGAILTAPWVRDALERLSGGTTIKTLPISALRQMAVPVVRESERADVSDELRRIAESQDEIDNRLRNLDEMRQQLWTKLWNYEPPIDTDPEP